MWSGPEHASLVDRNLLLINAATVDSVDSLVYQTNSEANAVVGQIATVAGPLPGE